MAMPATLCTIDFDPHRCRRESAVANGIVAEIRDRQPELRSWITFPLLNRTGSASELTITKGFSRPRPTKYAASMPYVMEAISTIEDAGVFVQQARVAVLLGRDVLAPHVDEFRSVRLLLPLNDQGDDFRHVFDTICFVMRCGQLWQVRGDVCHGAANISAMGARATVILDVELKALLCTEWKIPEDQIVRRPPFTEEARQHYERAALDLISRNLLVEAERVWLFLPFEHNVAAAEVYDELLAFVEMVAERAATLAAREYWLGRREFLLHPPLGFQVAAPLIRRDLQPHESSGSLRIRN